MGTIAFSAWQATGKDVPDLRDHEDEIGTIGMDDKPYPGRLYNPGYMEIVEGGWMVTVGNHSEIFAELADAEKMLWDEHSAYIFRDRSLEGRDDD